MNKRLIQQRVFTFALMVFLLLTATPMVLQASEQDAQSDWQFAGEIYLWGATITAETPGGAEAEIPFYQILNDLQMTFMGAVGARKDRWTIATDIMYLDIQEKSSRESGRFIQPPVTIDSEVDLKSWIVTPTVGYAVHDSATARVELFGGLRFLDLSATVKLSTDGNTRSDESVSENYWDAVVGARASINLTEHWYLPMFFDIGTGDTDGTWQAFAGIGYRFERVDTILAYRYLDYSFDDSNKALADMNIKGLFGGLMIRF